MFYISPQLTLLMLTVVPPVSLGAVCDLSHDTYAYSHRANAAAILLLGFLWSLPEETLEQDARSPRGHDQGRSGISLGITDRTSI